MPTNKKFARSRFQPQRCMVRVPKRGEYPNIAQAHCNRCSGERNHFILYVHEGEWSQDLPEDLDAGAIICGEVRYELLKWYWLR